LSHRPHTCSPRVLAAAALTALGTAALPWASHAAPAAGAQGLGAGTWEIATRIDQLDIPGLPAAMVRKIAEDPANAKPRGVCIASPADTPPPAAVFHTLNGACSYETWQADAGTLRAVLVCAPPDGGPGVARVEVSGSYTGTTFEVASETVARDATGATQLHMRSTISGTLASAGTHCPAS